MKLKNVIAGICGFSLALAASSSVMAAGGEPEGPNPQLAPAEEGAFVLAETLISITAAFVTRSGCGGTSGGPFSIAVDGTGEGSATYGGGSNPIKIDVTPGPAHSFGQGYFVDTTSNPGFLDAANSIQNLDGELVYSAGGAILISNSDFEMLEFTNYVHWDEHNIKDFWLTDDTGQHIADAGLEVITKLGYPRTKWRQTSVHWRQDGGIGFFRADKWLITPWNAADCHITISGEVDQLLGSFTLSGDVEVSDVAPNGG